MSNIIFLVTYTAMPGKRQAYLHELADTGILNKIRAEHGCLGYDFYESTDQSDILLLVEKWQDAECQEAHMQQPHMKEAMAIKEQYIQQTSVVKATPL